MTSPSSKRKPSLGPIGNGETSSSGSKKKSVDRPFYVAPDNKATPVQIMNETRSWLKTVNTRRPFTPREDTRSLFGLSTSRPPDARPPSAFSLTAKHFDESRPPSGTRLLPLEHRTDAVLPPKPPTAERHPTPGSSGRRKGSTASKVALVHSNSSPDQMTRRSGSMTFLESGGDNSPLSEEAAASPRITHRNSIASGDTAKPPTSPTRKVIEAPTKPDSGYLSEHRCHSGGSSRGSSADVLSHAQQSGGVNATRTHSGSSSRGGSGGRSRQQLTEECEDDGGDAYYKEHLAPTVDLLGAPSSELPDLISVSELLYQQLESGGLLGKRCRQRPHILKTVFKLLDRSDPKLHVNLARIILALKVSGNNLNTVCKLVYKVAKDKTNDTFFIDYKMSKIIVKTVSSSDVSQCQEALVYLTGAIKFITLNTVLVEQLVKAGCIEALAALQKDIVRTNMETDKINDQFAHILVQISGALRNLASITGTREVLISSGALDSTVTALEQYPADYDLALNAARLLSKSTQHADCCAILASKVTFCNVCRNLLFKFYSREDLVVRLCFILGNLTAHHEDSRQSLFPDKSKLNSFVKVFDHYLKVAGMCPTSPTSPCDSAQASDKVDEVLVKMVRLLANSCISEFVGRLAAASRSCVSFLLSIIMSRTVVDNEELVLNSISAINNITFYMTQDTGPDMLARQQKVAEALVSVVVQDHTEALRGAIGVFGNLSRERAIRDLLISRQLDRLLITLLDSGHQELLYGTVGVLLNLMADADRRHLLNNENGVRKLVDVLHDYSGNDWQLSGLVCKTLWNFTEHITTTETALGSDPRLALSLVDLLSDLVDPEMALSFGDTSDTAAFQTEMWHTEFLPVATKLLRRLENHQSQFEPL